MTKSQRTLLTIVITAAVAVGGLVLIANKSGTSSGTSGQYDKLAQCLTSKGVKFYGAWWCPHCAEEKRILGDSMKKINYIECAPPGDQQGQTEICKQAKIDSYPTWEFADGSRATGVQQPKDLADKAGCALDGTSAATNTPS